MAQKTSWNGAPLTESDINTYLMGEGGAWTSWTPTVTQSGSVTVTVTSAAFARYGRTILFRAHLSVTGSGTASNAIVLSLPVAASASYVLNHPINGSALLVDQSTSQWDLAIPVRATSTSTVYLVSVGSAVNTYLGNDGNFAAGLASGDTIWYAGSYEAAS